MGLVPYKRGLCVRAQLEPGNGSSPGSAKSSSFWAPHLQTIRNKSGFFISYLSSLWWHCYSNSDKDRVGFPPLPPLLPFLLFWRRETPSLFGNKGTSKDSGSGGMIYGNLEFICLTLLCALLNWVTGVSIPFTSFLDFEERLAYLLWWLKAVLCERRLLLF